MRPGPGRACAAGGGGACTAPLLEPDRSVWQLDSGGQPSACGEGVVGSDPHPLAEDHSSLDMAALANGAGRSDDRLRDVGARADGRAVHYDRSLDVRAGTDRHVAAEDGPPADDRSARDDRAFADERRRDDPSLEVRSVGYRAA